MIRGNIEGIRQSALDELEKLFDTELERDKFLPDRLMATLVRFTDQFGGVWTSPKQPLSAIG